MEQDEKRRLLEERARRLAQKVEHTGFETPEDAVGFLVFDLNRYKFAVAVDKVLQTIMLGRMVELVGVPRHIRGITRIGGKNVPLVYLPFYFEPEREGFVDADNVIVIKEEEFEFGLLVHRLLETRHFSASEILRTPENLPAKIKQVLAGTTKDGIGILDTGKLVAARGFAVVKEKSEVG